MAETTVYLHEPDLHTEKYWILENNRTSPNLVAMIFVYRSACYLFSGKKLNANIRHLLLRVGGKT